MSIYCEVINLPQAADRRAVMAAELGRAGLAAAFHPAFDYRDDPQGDLGRHTTPFGPWGSFDIKARACTISHMRVWQRFLATQAGHCLVLEDDVFLSPDLGAWLADLSWWPSDADIVKIERWRGRRLKVLLQPHTRHRGRAVARLLSRHVGAAGYVLSRHAARLALDAQPYRIAIDNLLFNANASALARRLTVYQVNPALAEQGNDAPQRSAAPPESPHSHRPRGWRLWRQKLQRGYYEVAYPPATIWKAFTGRARLERVLFEPRPLYPPYTTATPN